MKFLRNCLIWLLCFLIGLPPEHVWATDQIVVESGATLTETPSGKPMLNIAAPNASGLSHNKFTDFNVTAAGLVINNATGLANTSLAGVIEANPNFSGSAATLILNEVTSSNRSYLNGATEIGGQAADYILANPNGITCNGCGFINTPRATLSTGTPTFSGTALSGLSVNAGDIVVEGLGLDATSASKFDIVTRATEINAQINADDLGIHTGRQDFDYAARSGTAKLHDGSTKPTFSIDSTALGGMYAGRITLVGTEAGVGVRIAGDMATSATDMIITADGKLELKSDISAKTEIALTSTSSDITTAKTVYAGTTLTATANAGKVTPGASGTFAAQGDVTIKADQVTSDSGGKIIAGMTNVGAISTSGTLDVQATTKIQTGDGFLGAGSAVKLKGPTVNLSRAADDNSETVRSRGTLTIESGNLTATNGRIASDGTMLLKGNSPIVIGEGTYNSAAAISLTGDSVSNAATMTSDQSISLTSTTGDITNTGSIAATTTTELNAANDIINTGTIESQTGTTITATNNLDNQSGGKIKSATTTVVNADTVTNAGSIYSTTTNTVTANTITNTGTIAAGTDLALKVGSLTNDAGVLFADDNIIIYGIDGVSNAALFDNASGIVQTVGSDITINADAIQNRKSVFVAGTTHKWTKFVQAHVDAEYAAAGCLSDQGCNWILSLGTPIGTYTSTSFGLSPHRGYFYYYEGAITEDSPAGQLSSGGDLTLSGTSVLNDNSTMFAEGNVTITADSFNNNATQLYSSLYRYSSRVLHEATGFSNSVVEAVGDVTVNASGDFGNGTFISKSTSSPLGPVVDNLTLEVSPKTTSLVDSSNYVDMIPGRDALFLENADPTATFVYETRVDFINVGNYYGSDYFISKLSVTPETIITRLGDAYFDTTLVREAIVRETGKRFLDDAVTDDITQMKNLIDNGIAAESSLNLSYGVALSAAQINALTSDIVWYVEEVIDGRLVTVPKVYLSSATLNSLSTQRASIKGDNVTVSADTIDNDHGLIDADTDVTLTATNDLTNTSADIIAGNDVTLSSTNGDVVMNAQVETRTDRGQTTSVQHRKSSLDAGGKLTVTANNGDIAIRGTDITTGAETSLTAGNNVTIGANEVTRSVYTGDTQYDQTQYIGSSLKSGGKLDLSAGGDAKIEGSAVSATGDATLTATGNVTIASTTDTLNASGDDDGHLNTATNTASSLTSDAKVSVTSGGTMQVKGSSLTAGTDLDLQATGNVVIESSEDTFDQKTSTYKKKTITQNTADLTAGGDITVGTLIGDMSLISAELESGGDITLNTPNGQLYLGVRKDYYEEAVSESHSSHLTTTYINKGRIDETVIPTLLTADGNIAIVAADGVIVDYKDTGSLTDSIDQLSQSPGLAWMKDVQARSDVTWNAVEEYHHSWNYTSQGISPVGAALISLSVGWAMGPAGFVEGGVGNSVAGSKLVAMGFSKGTAAAIANAGFSTLATQAATAIVGNNGDISAALKQLGSMDTVKALATSMVTAGLIEGLGISDKLTADTSKLTGAELRMTDFANRLKVGIANGVISSTVDSVINGAPLTDNLKSALANAAVTAVSQTAFKSIGTFAGDNGIKDGDLLKVAMHALTGCAIGQASSQNCMAGAMAAGLQELAGDNLKAITSDPATQIELAGLLGALAVTISGGDADAINTAAAIGKTANAFNRQLHTTEIRAIEEKAKELAAADADGLSEKEWQARLGQAALREVDRKFDEDIVPDPIADQIIAAMAESHGAEFIEGMANSFKFLQRDQYYENTTTFSLGLLKDREFYDNALTQWAEKTYSGPLPDSISASELALVSAVQASAGCGNGFESCAGNYAMELELLDPTQSSLTNGSTLIEISDALNDTWLKLNDVHSNTKANYEDLKQRLDGGDQSVTQAQVDQAYSSYRQADAAMADTFKAATSAVDVAQGLVSEASSQEVIADGFQAIDDFIQSIPDLPVNTLATLVEASKGARILTQAAEGDPAALEHLSQRGQEIWESFKALGDTPEYVEGRFAEADALYRSGDFEGAGQIYGAMAATVGGTLVEVVKPNKANMFTKAVKGLAELKAVVKIKKAISRARAVDADIKWDGGIQEQGMPWEDYLAKSMPSKDRLPPDFKTFDFFDDELGRAISAKTLNTQTASRLDNPKQILGTVKKQINDTLNFKEYVLSRKILHASDIKSRTIQLAVPHDTTKQQWLYLQQAVEYGQINGVEVIITKVR